MNLPGAPTVDFHKLFDGENITQEDLVLWISVGTHHLVGGPIMFFKISSFKFL